MKHKIYVIAALEIFLLLLVYWLALHVFHTEYLFKWATHNWSFYLFFSAIALLILFSKTIIVSVSMTIGITAGLFIGSFLGNWIYTINRAKIVEGMSAEEIYMLEWDPGFYMWFGIILLSIIIGIAIEIIKLIKNRKQRTLT